MKPNLAYLGQFVLVLILAAGCDSQSNSHRDAIVNYQNTVASIGWQAFNISENQKRHYEANIETANELSRQLGGRAVDWLNKTWNENKEKTWIKYRNDINSNFDEIKSQMTTSLSSPPKGCEMLSQQLNELIKVTEEWKSVYAGEPRVWDAWEQDVVMHFKEVNLEFDKLKDELLRDIAPPVKKPIEGTFKYQSSLFGSTIEERLQFRKTGCVIWQMFSDIPFGFKTYSLDGDRVTVSSSDGGRQVFKMDGQDLLWVERYDKTGKKDEDHKMKRYVKI